MTVTPPTQTTESYVVGVDFGTLSGRAVVVRVRDGEELAAAVHAYPHGVIEHELPTTGRPLPPDWALQHPDDWREVLRTAVPAAVAASGIDPAAVIGIATDFTACTVLPVRTDGTPLAETALGVRPHAWPKLWKHHAAQSQADRINHLAHQRGEKWISRYGGRISAEWQYAKALQVLEEDPATYAATERWIEAADWIVWQLAGVETRNTCTAGYKGIHQDGQYPSEDYLAALHPGFADFARTRLEHPLSPLGTRAGSLTAEAAAWTGLPEGIAVATGNVDAHVAAPAAQAVENGQLLAIMGTSTCHVVNGPVLADVPGICGVVDGGIVEGAYGYEAGQSAVGDIFAWWLRQGVPADYRGEAAATGEDLHQLLSRKIADQPVGGHGLVALDWMNGNRSTLVDHHLSGVIVGLTLATRPEEIYRALLEATAFGTRTIVDALEQGGVPVTEFIVTGGLKKNPLLMQIYADVLRRPVSLAESAQGPALGSAIHAAVAAGAHPDVRTAAAAMGRVRRGAYQPDTARADAYDSLYSEYRALHDHFGTGPDKLLHRLRAIRNAALTARHADPEAAPVAAQKSEV
ncbi:ribulokinase [Streptomyces sp. ISL-86]|uniref:ribulokinase n=1 Tax=Streptomyces sp. ISL-86 TaxID=2819187 RepID=UPI001BEC897A|nr:ribulokinase [Streptomyces sp. ISL-86]MBT2457393.1 ribulokinase [Streptomyces sp. ISL-86]